MVFSFVSHFFFAEARTEKKEERPTLMGRKKGRPPLAHVFANIRAIGGDVSLEFLENLPMPIRVIQDDDINTALLYDYDTYICTLDPAFGQVVYVSTNSDVLERCTAHSAEAFTIKKGKRSIVARSTTVLFDSIELAQQAIAVDENGLMSPATEYSQTLWNSPKISKRDALELQRFALTRAPVFEHYDTLAICKYNTSAMRCVSSREVFATGFFFCILMTLCLLYDAICKHLAHYRRNLRKKEKKRAKKRSSPPPSPATVLADLTDADKDITPQMVRASSVLSELHAIFGAERFSMDTHLIRKMDANGWIAGAALAALPEISRFRFDEKQICTLLQDSPLLETDVDLARVRPRAWRCFKGLHRSN